MYEEYVSFLVLFRFFFSPEGAAVFFPASFFSAGAFPPAGALPPVEGFFSATLGGILDEDMNLNSMSKYESVMKCWIEKYGDVRLFRVEGDG